MATRTLSQIVLDMQSWFQSRLNQVDTSSNTVLSALTMQAIAGIIATAWTALGNDELAQGISSPNTINSGDLADIAYNLNIVPKNPYTASGFVSFRRGTVPPTQIQIGNQDGSGGITVGTTRDVNGNSIQFITTETVYFTTSTPKSVTSGLYEVIAPIQALQPGTSGNQIAGAITQLITSTAGVDSIINYVETTGGTGTESNLSIANRMSVHLLGLQPGISQGLRSIALAQPGVQDAAVVGPDDSYFEQSGVGAVDLVIKGTNESTAIDQFNFVSPTQWTLESRPASSISSVIAIVGLTQSALTPNVQYEFSQDTVSEKQFSVESNDHLSWLGTNLPNVGTAVTVNYTYDQLISSIQDIINLPQNHYPSAQVLVKAATAQLINMNFTITRDGTVNSTTMTNNITTILTNYINNLNLGALISQSALVTQIKSASGIQQLLLPFNVLAFRGSGGVNDLQLTKYQFADLDINSIVINYTN